MQNPLGITHFSREGKEAPPTIISPVFQWSSRIRAYKKYHYPRHRHNNCEIILSVSGPYSALVNNVEVAINVGDALVVTPGDFHEDLCLPGVRYDALAFDLDIYDPAVPNRIFREGASPAVRRIRAARILADLIAEIQGELKRRDLNYAYLLDALVQEFFWRMLRMLPTESLSPELVRVSEDRGFTTSLYRFFETRRNASPTLSEMADALGMSESSLSHKCRRLMSVPPHQAFLAYQMRYALNLIKSSDMKIGEISDHLGFKNPYHFSKVFSKVHGRPPSSFRR